MSAPAVLRDYDRWFIQQGYGPGAYPDVNDLDFLGVQEKVAYNGYLGFQTETMRVHETFAPTTATVYDITDLSRHVPGYWEMMLAYAKADRVWNYWYGNNMNCPRTLNSRWSRTKKNLRDLIIQNQRAADSAAASLAAEDGDEGEGEGEDEDEDESDGEDEDEDEEGSVESVEK